MASIHKRQRSRYYWAAWRDVNGRLFYRSTKQIDRSKALEFALSCERAEKLAGAGSLTETQARKIIEDIMERTGTGDVLRNPTVADWLNTWLENKQANRSEATGERYRHVVEGFTAHLGEKAKRPLNSLTTRDVQSYLTGRTKEGCSPTTVAIDGKILRTALNRARAEGLIAVNPAEAAELPKRKSVERGTFTDAEIKLLVDAAEGEWKTLILLGYYTGARLSDCCSVVWDGERTKGNLKEGVNFTERTLAYWQQKTQTLICIPLHQELQSHLEKLANTDKVRKFVSPHMAGLKSGGRHGLSETFKRIVIRAGLDLQTVQGGGRRKINKRTFHALRHSFTSALANAGVSRELRMKLTGHKSEAIHAGYTHHELDNLRKAVGKLPGLK